MDATSDQPGPRKARDTLGEAIALGVREGAFPQAVAAPVLERLRQDPEVQVDLAVLSSWLGVDAAAIQALCHRVETSGGTRPGALFPSGVRQIAKDAFAADSRFGETLVREGALTREQLADAVAGQQALRGQGVTMRLGEVLVAKRLLTPEQVKQFLHLVDKQLLHCGKCGKNYNVKNWRPEAEVFCPHCSIALVPPPTERTIDAHATRIVPPGGMVDEHAGEGKPFGRYRLLKKLGQGGMGVVWKAWDTQLKRVVALKQILVKGEEDREQVERFMREAQLAAKLRHPHIIAVFDVGVHEGQHYFTSEYVAGQSIEEAMKGKVSPKQMLSWVKDVAEALAYAHEQGVVHRDVKPANVLVDGHQKPFVMDFGLAKEVDLTTKEGSRKATLTAAGAVMGTPMYMSPEQAAGQTAKLGPASDQFSLGVMLYQMLTKRLPFAGRSLGELFIAIMYSDPKPPSQGNTRIHRDVETICLKALEKNPAKRYATMADLAADLGRYLDGEPIVARPVSRAERVWRKAVKHRWIVIPSAAAVLVLAGLLAWMGVTAHQHALKFEGFLADARTYEEAKDWDRARSAYQSARDLDKENRTAQEGYARADKAVQALADEKDAEVRRSTTAQKDQNDAIELTELGRKGVDAANQYLYNKDANYEELVKKVEVGQAKLEEAIQKFPNLAIAHYLLGKCWDLRGWDDKAEACFRKAIELRPEFGPAHYELGRLFMMRSYYVTLAPTNEETEVNRPEARRLADEATAELSAAQRGVALDDPLQRAVADVMKALAAGDKESTRRLAEAGIKEFGTQPGVEDFQWLAACGAASRSDEQLTALTQALAIRPRHAPALYGRANLRKKGGDIDGAIRDWTEALRVNPRFVAALYNRGTSRVTKDLDGAIQDFTKVLTINPQFVGAYYNRGGARQLKGDLDGAIRDYTGALKINPSSVFALAGRASARYCRGDYDGAREDLTQALKITPNFAEDFFSRAIARRGMDDLDGAIQDYTAALKIDPRYVDALVNRGVAYALKGDLDATIRDCTEALKIKPSAQAFTQRGAARGGKGDIDGAIQDYTEALKINPCFPEALDNRGVARDEKADHDEAIQDYTEALKINPRFAKALFDRGLARQRKGMIDGAIQDYTEALKINPCYSEALANRADVRQAKGDLDGAIADYTKALNVAPANWPYRKQVENELRAAREKRGK